MWGPYDKNQVSIQSIRQGYTQIFFFFFCECYVFNHNKYITDLGESVKIFSFEDKAFADLAHSVLHLTRSWDETSHQESNSIWISAWWMVGESRFPRVLTKHVPSALSNGRGCTEESIITTEVSSGQREPMNAASATALYCRSQRPAWGHGGCGLLGAE